MKETLKNNGRSIGTISRHIFALKKFLVFLSEEYKISIINLFQIKCKKEKKRTVDFLEKWEIDRIRNVGMKTITELRTRTMFEVLLFTGCRISEVLTIKRSEVNFQKGEVEVNGKGGKKRVVFLGESMHWIQRYINEVNGEYLFVSQYNRKLDRIDSLKAMHELGKSAGLSRPLGHHILRKTFTTNLIWSGADPRTVQEMLGHEDLETTMRYYVGVTNQRMRDVHQRMSGLVGTGIFDSTFGYMLSLLHGRKETKQVTQQNNFAYEKKRKII